MQSQVAAILFSAPPQRHYETIRKDVHILDYAATLGGCVQQYTDVLEQELKRLA